MTVILILVFLITCLGIDAYKQYKLRHASDVMFSPEIGWSMADGGKKIEDEKKS